MRLGAPPSAADRMSIRPRTRRFAPTRTSTSAMPGRSPTLSLVLRASRCASPSPGRVVMADTTPPTTVEFGSLARSSSAPKRQRSSASRPRRAARQPVWRSFRSRFVVRLRGRHSPWLHGQRRPAACAARCPQPANQCPEFGRCARSRPRPGCIQPYRPPRQRAVQGFVATTSARLERRPDRASSALCTAP